MPTCLTDSCQRSPDLGAGNGPDQSILIFRAQSGDVQAFDELVEPHLHRIYAIAMRITRNREDAEDACQESLLKAFIHLQSFQGHARFSTWLTRIAINESLMIFRKLQTETRYRCDDNDLYEMPQLQRMKDRSDTSDPEVIYAREEQNELLWDAINSLETKSRVAVCQLGLEERETRDIAEASSMSRSGVRSRLQRAIRKLRTIMESKPRYGGEQIRDVA